jgi:hypothetical protein
MILQAHRVGLRQPAAESRCAARHGESDGLLYASAALSAICQTPREIAFPCKTGHRAAKDAQADGFAFERTKAFSSEADAGSREEKCAKTKT